MTKNKEEKEEEEKDYTITIFIVIGLMIVALAIIFGVIDFCTNPKISYADYVNASATFFGGVLIFATIFYQKKQYEAQLKEFKKSVLAQNASLALITAQNEELKLQTTLAKEQYKYDQYFKVLDQFFARRAELNFNHFIEHQILPVLAKKYKERIKEILRVVTGESERYEAMTKVLNEKFDALILDNNQKEKLGRYIQLAFNILYLIEVEEIENASNTDFRKPHFYASISSIEQLLIKLALFGGFKVGPNSYDWHFENSEQFIDLLATDKSIELGFAIDVMKFNNAVKPRNSFL